MCVCVCVCVLVCVYVFVSVCLCSNCFLFTVAVSVVPPLLCKLVIDAVQWVTSFGLDFPVCWICLISAGTPASELNAMKTMKVLY